MKEAILAALADNPLLLLFVVAAIGYPLGKVRVGGAQLGVAAVLFVGLAAGAVDQRLRLPEVVGQIGLVLFVYTVGLSAGPGFFATFRSHGARVVAVAVLGPVVGLITTFLVAKAGGLAPATGAGGFCGALTTTPALASVIDLAKKLGGDPVVGYSVAYPVGVLGVLAACAFYLGLAKKRGYVSPDKKSGELVSRTALVGHRCAGQSLQELRKKYGLDVVFGRYSRDGAVALADASLRLKEGDAVTVVGTVEQVQTALDTLGQAAPFHLADDRSQMDFRRVLVSNSAYVGKTLRDLKLPVTLGITVTRIRRGDVDMVPTADMALQAGDRVRVLADSEHLNKAAKELGDSYESVSEVDVVSLSIGIALGLLVGLVSVPLPGGMSFSLGLAGGPLFVALILGAVHRTGPVVWEVPYSANLTLRQVGLVLFFAAVGTRSGFEFAQTVFTSQGFILLVSFGLATMTTCVFSIYLAHRLFKVSPAQVAGMVSAVHTQPAVLSFVREHTDDEDANLGYATVYPLASVVKIVLAQILFMLLR